MENLYKSMIKERIEQYGVNTLSDEEAIFLLTGVPLPLIKGNVNTYGLVELIKYTGIMNLTKAQQRKMELLFSLVKRISLADYKNKQILNSSSKVGEYLVKELQFLKNEVFTVSFLDSQCRLIKTDIVSSGTINEAAIYPRTVVKTVLDNSANSVILGHNHPGGSLKPSAADIEVTKKIVAALKTINVAVMDHIIVAENKYYSFAEQGLLNT